MSKATKRYLVYGILFCLGAILFAVLYYCHVIKHLNLILASVYVAYLAGLGLIFNCAYNKKHLHTTSAWISGIFGTLLLIGSIVLLIIGFTNGQIQF